MMMGKRYPASGGKILAIVGLRDQTSTAPPQASSGLHNLEEERKRTAGVKASKVASSKRPEIGTAHREEHTQSTLYDWWLWEVLGAIVSVVSTVAIVIVLAIHNGKPLPIWPLSITLNTLVSVLATISKVCLGRVLPCTRFSRNSNLKISTTG